MREHMIEEMFECLHGLKNISERVLASPEMLNRSDVNILHSIYVLCGEHASVKITDISRRLNVQSPNVIAAVKRMEAQGLVIKVSGTKDKRVVHVKLTDAGKAIVDKYVLSYYAMLEESLSEEEEELLRLLAGLKKLTRKVERAKTAFEQYLGGEDDE